MKKKILALLIAISCIFSLNNVANADVTTSSTVDGTTYTLKLPNGGQTGASSTINFGSVKAYCIDPGSTEVGSGVNCPAEVLNDDFGNAVKYILSSGKSADVMNTAIRIVAIVTGDGQIGYKLDTKDHIDSACSYVAAAYKVGKDSGYGTSNVSSYSKYKSSGNADCKSWGVTGEPISLAISALKEAKSASKASSSTGSAPTANVKVNGATATITVDNSKGASDATLTVNCDSNTTGAGCGTHTIAKGASPQTFTVNSKVNDEKQCGTFTATLSYTAASTDSGKGCTEVTRYKCSKHADALQDFVGCTAGLGTSTPGSGTSTPGSGSTNQTINLTDPNGGGNTIHLKCDKKQCPYTDDQIKIIADGAGLCDKDGNTLVSVEQAALYTQDVEDCIIDNNKFLVKSSDSEVCKTYCVEDYSFKSDGLMLSAQDKDENGRVIITAGSYFNFAKEDVKAVEQGVVKCYTKIDLDAFKSKVESEANKICADSMKSVTHSCSCTTDPDNPEVKNCTDVVTTTTYTASYTNNKIEWSSTPSVSTNTNLSSCDGLTNTPSHPETCRDNLKSTVNGLIIDLEKCATEAKEKVSYDKECNSEVTFDYGFNVEARQLTAENTSATDVVKYHANCGGDYSKCTSHSETQPKATLDLGVGASVSYPTLEYVEKISTITAEYSLKGIGICNDYNSGTSNYPVEKSECDKIEGATWVEGWPVSYDTPQGKYQYEITVKNFGHIKDNGKCKTLDDLVKKDISYGCEYQVNDCDECKFYCKPESTCNVPDCDEECIYRCAGVGCIYDAGSGLALNYQPISMINVDQSFAYLAGRNAAVATVAAGRNAAPQATKLAATTATHRNVDSYNWGTEKGKATLDLIEYNGEEIYSGDPEYKVTLTMSKINEIKKNNQKEKEGFLNKSLKCTVKDKNAEYVVCTSTFLDELRSEGILEGKPNFISSKEISDYVSGYNVVSARKSGTGPAWK